MGLINQKCLNAVLAVKNEAQKRFILDHNEVPHIQQEYSAIIEDYKQQVEKLKKENSLIKQKLDELSKSNV